MTDNIFKVLSIVIPVYNEGRFISKVLSKINEADSLGLEKEIIIVDDASTDDSKNKIMSFVDKNKGVNIKTIFKDKNEGKGAALKTGFLYTTGDIVIVQDADLEYSPNEYPVLLKPFLQDRADVVYGSRFISGKAHRVLYYWHYVANTFLTTLSNMLTNLNLTDMETGYKAFRGEIIRELAKGLQSKRFGFEPEITAKIAKIKGIKVYEVGISYWGRTYEEGKKIGWRDGIRAVWEIIKYNVFT